jgi:iron complex transport system substrate-binding protein
LVREHARDLIPLYSLRADELAALLPELIVTQTLCRVCAVSDVEVHAVARTLENSPLIVDLEPTTLGSLLEGIRKVAKGAGAAEAGERLAGSLEERIAEVGRRSRSLEASPSVAFLEWLDPIFCSGHWNPEIVRLAGGSDPLGVVGEPARVAEWGEILRIEPDFLFISCCGFSVERTLAELPLLTGRPGWSELPAVRNGQVFIADGRRWFSAPGPGLVESLEILANAIAPELHPLPPGLPPAHRLTDF